MIDVLFISPAQFKAKPQVGSPRQMSWEDLAEWLSECAWGESKDAVGGWSPGLYRDAVRRKTNLVHVACMVFDIDGGGDIDKLAEEFAAHDAVLHETFSSRPEEPRCRVVLRLATPISLDTYEHVHRVIRRRLREGLRVGVDEGAKDATRLSYSPVRMAGAGYRWIVTRGKPVDGQAIALANPPLVRTTLPPPRLSDSSKVHYHHAALQKAADNIVAATPGGRHEILNKEAFSLARLGLSLSEVHRALFPAALASMGEERRREIERTIADGFYARKRAS